MSAKKGKWSTTIEIDGQKLAKEIEKRGVTKAQVSMEVGHADNYMNGVITTGKIPVSTMKLLELHYNIKLADIEKKVEEPVVEKVEVPVVPQIEPVDMTPVVDKLKEVVVSVDTSNEKVIEKLNDLIGTLNRLGNIQMQTMEYIKSIMDSESEIKGCVRQIKNFKR